MKNKHIFLIIIATLSLTAIMCSAGGSSSGTISATTATLSELTGTVQTLKPTVGELADAQDGDSLTIGDQVITYVDSRARVDLSNGTLIRVGPLSSFTLTEMVDGDTGPAARFKLDLGSIWIILNGGSVDVDTPAGVASVTGSYLFVTVDQETGKTNITCLEGHCSLKNGTGTINLVAGQTGEITNTTSIPQTGKMTDEEVADWLNNNPEATLVIVPLTSTVQASGNSEGGTFSTATPSNTPNTTTTATPTQTAVPSETSTKIVCGPPETWKAYTVGAGETLDSLAEAFQIDVDSVQTANCMGDSTAVFEGMTLYMPDVATITPTPTITYTPTQTYTPKPPTNTPVPSTATFTPTATATNAPAAFNAPGGPGVPSAFTISECINSYNVDVTDPEGVNSVKVVYTITYSDTSTETGSFPLPLDTGSTYKTQYSIPTFSIAGADSIEWHFEMKDGQGVTHVDSNIYEFTDPLDCGATTDFIAEVGPQSFISVCDNNFSVEVSDPEGINVVWVQFSLNDPTFASPNYLTLSYAGAGGTVGYEKWEILNATITSNVADVVYWRFKAEDGMLNHEISYPFPAPSDYYFYTDATSVGCIGAP